MIEPKFFNLGRTRIEPRFDEPTGRMIYSRNPTGLHRSMDNMPISHFYRKNQWVETVRIFLKKIKSQVVKIGF